MKKIPVTNSPSPWDKELIDRMNTKMSEATQDKPEKSIAAKGVKEPSAYGKYKDFVINRCCKTIYNEMQSFAEGRKDGSSPHNLLLHSMTEELYKLRQVLTEDNEFMDALRYIGNSLTYLSAMRVTDCRVSRERKGNLNVITLTLNLPDINREVSVGIGEKNDYMKDMVISSIGKRRIMIEGYMAYVMRNLSVLASDNVEVDDETINCVKSNLSTWFSRIYGSDIEIDVYNDAVSCAYEIAVKLGYIKSFSVEMNGNDLISELKLPDGREMSFSTLLSYCEPDGKPCPLKKAEKTVSVTDYNDYKNNVIKVITVYANEGYRECAKAVTEDTLCDYLDDYMKLCSGVEEFMDFERSVMKTLKDNNTIMAYTILPIDNVDRKDVMLCISFRHRDQLDITTIGKEAPIEFMIPEENKKDMDNNTDKPETMSESINTTSDEDIHDDIRSEPDELNDAIHDLILSHDTLDADNIRDKYDRIIELIEKRNESIVPKDDPEKMKEYFEKLKKTIYDLLSNNDTPDVRHLKEVYNKVLGLNKKKNCGTDSKAMDMPLKPINSNVSHPAHYNQYEKETIDMMEDIWGPETVRQWCIMTAFKYRMRMGHKSGNSIQQDFEKEQWYLNKAKELRNKKV